MKIFVDTSAWFVLYDPNENRFPAARRFFEEHKLIPAELFTSNYVLDESISLIRKKIGHSQAVIFAESLFHSSVTRILEVDQTVRNQAWSYFKRYTDKEYSFTDCTSFALMKQFHVRNAFAFDDHFRHFGFTVVPGKTQKVKRLHRQPKRGFP